MDDYSVMISVSVTDLLLVAALAVLLYFLLKLRSRLDSLRLQVAQQWNDLLELQRALMGAAETEPDPTRQQQLEQRLELLSKQQEQMLLRDANTAPYLQAIRHAERGGSVDELMAVYDLGRAEAELILSLHGPK